MTASTATSSLVDDRIARLQAIAEIDPQAAYDAAWAWIERLRAGLPGEAAEIELAQLFAAGTPAVVDGQTDGMLVGFKTPDADLDQTGRALHATAKAVTIRLGLMPWLGKKFDRSAQRGTNSVTTLGAVFTTLLAPGYRMRRVGDHWEGFDMLNRVEASVVSPDTQVLVLDYETIGTNPWPINHIRDEAVQIVPGIYLGAKLWHQDNGYRQLAYWAAKSPIAG
ncbi:MAG: hypothetical protein QOH91_2544 [Mycobacterium sp.]|jgi:hypothetical protein|nr:hypothetical protein [Mycobacterium sp.]